MPNVYANVTELLQAGELNEGDFVMIGKVKSKVCNSWLHTTGWHNAYTINNLGLNAKTFASAMYGYQAVDDGSFPDSRRKDYPALTRASAVLMALTELKDVNTKRRVKDQHDKEAKLALLKDTLRSVDHDILRLSQGPF
jgi:hypothetical protein